MISEIQKNILVNFMELHGDLNACNKESYKLWDELTCELNQAGEPLTRRDWAITWSKMKKNVRLQFTRYYEKGKIKSLKLSPLEDKIKTILGLSEEKIKSSILKKTKVVYKSVKSYYASLYKQNVLKLRKRRKMTMAEVSQINNEIHQSWKDMPAKMKENIILQHKHARDLRVHKIADYLKDAELNQSLLKSQSTSCGNNGDASLGDNVGNDATETDLLREYNPKEAEDSTNNLASNDNEDSSRVVDTTIEQNWRCNTRPNVEIELPPPPPPPVVTAEALYNLIQSSHEIENVPWISLPEAEKRQFRKAVTCLKKDYLRQYRCYLHNLSSINLHKHMVQTLFNVIV